MTPRRRRLAVAAVIVGISALWPLMIWRSTGSTLGRLRAQGLPTTPKELDEWRHPVPDADNLATAILDAQSAFRTPRDTNTPFLTNLMVPPHPVDPTLLARWRTEVGYNREALEALRAGRGRTASHYPVTVQAGIPISPFRYREAMALARVCALASLTDAESGRPGEAVNDVEDILLIARSLEPEPNNLSQLFRVVFIETAARATALSLPRATVDEGAWKSLQDAFAKADDLQGIRTGLVGEIANADRGFDLMTPLGWSGDFHSFFYHCSGRRAVDQDSYVGCLGDLLDALNHPFPDAIRLGEAPTLRLRSQHQRLSKRFGFSPMSSSGVTRGILSQAGCLAYARSATLVCAVERHRLAHEGRLPDKLSDLVPALISSVPTDPFDGQPLRYLRTGESYTLYSVGQDTRDDGGQIGKPFDDTRGPDVGLKVGR